MTQQEWAISFGLFLKAAGIQHFTPLECCEVGRLSGPARLEPPPPRLWPNILDTLDVLEWLRDRIGEPYNLNSGFRSPTYNSKIGGAASSQHLVFRATDGWAEETPPKEIADLLEEHPQAHLLGIGRYKTFTHLDTRGQRARWGSN